jgi:plastocyanin
MRWATLKSLLLVGCLLAFGSPLAGQTSATPPVVLEVGTDGVQHGNIALDSYEFIPNHLVVRAGIPVELTLHSLTMLTPHNFIIKSAEAEVDISQDVGAGKTITIRFKPMRPGIYPFYCDRKLLFFANHREKGMEGKLEVR